MKRALLVLLCSAVSIVTIPARASAQPDVRQMSGTPLPVGDLTPGTVTVRVLRGAISNPIAGQDVELQGTGSPAVAKTNEAGRAEFANVRIGARVKAVAVVAGERLESQEFTVPATGGIRVMLVATDPQAAKRGAEEQKLAAAPAQPGTVVFGSESRFVFEMGDDGLSVFNIFQVLNSSRTPVQTAEPLVFDLPDAAKGATILDGSSPQAIAAGKRVTVTGPFAPGATLVQFVYTIPYSGSELTVEQKLPAPLTQLAVAAQRVGDLHLTSPQMTQHHDATSNGQAYIVGQGPAVKAGDVVTFSFTGLPRVTVWPRNLALALAVVILVGGAWASVRGSATTRDAARQRKLEAQRDRLFGELATIEQQHRESTIDPQRYAARRHELVAALERVYGELAEEGVAVGRAS